MYKRPLERVHMFKSQGRPSLMTSSSVWCRVMNGGDARNLHWALGWRWDRVEVRGRGGTEARSLT